ncbi:CDP-alcohol phosphatidyltransferase [Achromatium sp. WMS2]|nr:CDP-alcohol phosphatidyltransferase [Achromatium sp. WMS2]
MPLFAARYIPNIISCLRILLAIPVGILLLEHRYQETLGLFVMASISDGLDGFLAKRFGWQSRLGGFLDPLADKTLFITTFVILGIIGLVPIWLVLLALIRDVLIIAGTLSYQLAVEDVQPAPSLISKINTFIQMLLVIAVIVSAGFYQLPKVLTDGLELILLFTLITSGWHYAYLWGNKAFKLRRS